MWGPCLGHKMANFWIFQRKRLQDPSSSVICNQVLPAFLRFLHNILLHITLPLASGQVQSSTSWHGHQVIYWVTKLIIAVNVVTGDLKFGMKHPWNQSFRSRKKQLEGQCEGHVWAIERIYDEYFKERGCRVHHAMEFVKMSSIKILAFAYILFLLFQAIPRPLARCRALHLGFVTEVLTDLLTESQSWKYLSI